MIIEIQELKEKLSESESGLLAWKRQADSTEEDLALEQVARKRLQEQLSDEKDSHLQTSGLLQTAYDDLDQVKEQMSKTEKDLKEELEQVKAQLASVTDELEEKELS